MVLGKNATGFDTPTASSYYDPPRRRHLSNVVVEILVGCFVIAIDKYLSPADRFDALALMQACGLSSSKLGPHTAGKGAVELDAICQPEVENTVVVKRGANVTRLSPETTDKFTFNDCSHQTSKMWILPLVGILGSVVGFCFLTLAIGKHSCP